MLYSLIITFSMVTHGWLYDYANRPDPLFPGSTLEGLPIWPNNDPKIFKCWEPGDDEKKIQYPITESDEEEYKLTKLIDSLKKYIGAQP